MKYLIIDIGTYSVKFLVVQIERKKKIEILSNSEFVLSHYIEDQSLSEDATEQEIRLAATRSIVSQYFEDREFGGKIITQLSGELISTRQYKIPIKNRKKAELAVPFQLEEDIPFSVSDIHFASLLKSAGEFTDALVAFSPRVHFEEFYNTFVGLGVVPDIITSEESCFAQFVNFHENDESFCIVDLGHTTSKAYFFENQKLVSSHISYIAGKSINRSIAKNYSISMNEAEIYKHQNSFFLTSEQYKKVNKQQKDFALMMQSTVSPLVADIKRWMIGHRLKTGQEVSKIYLTGGTSNIKNIHNFVLEQLDVPTFRLKAYKGQEVGKIDTDKKIENKFALSVIMGIAAIDRKEMINFRTGEYSPSGADVVPLFSLSFLGLRSGIVALIVLISLTVEIVVKNQQLTSLNKKINKVLKKQNNLLRIKPRLVKRFRRKKDTQTAKTILSVLKRSVRSQKSTVMAIEQASRIDAIRPLAELSSSLSPGQDIFLSYYRFSGKSVKAVFNSKKPNNLRSFKDSLSGLDYTNQRVDLNSATGEISLNYKVSE